MLSRERPLAPSGLLPAPAPLPNLATAFSRRAAIFGAAATTGLLSGSAARALAADADRHLTAMAAEICSTLDGAAYAFDEVHDEADHDRRLGHANALTLDMVALPAIGLAGVLAKAKAYLDSNSYDVLNLAELADSLTTDMERVLEGRTA